MQALQDPQIKDAIKKDYYYCYYYYHYYFKRPKKP